MFKNSIKLNYFSYYKINQKQQIKSIYNYIYIFQKYNKLIFKYLKLPKKKKYFSLIKSPKCYKFGKLLINYYYIFFI
jgi:hypothetical protein